MVICYVNFITFKIIYGTDILNLILILMILYLYSKNVIKTDGDTRIFVLFLPLENGVEEEEEGKYQRCSIFFNRLIHPHLLYSTNIPILHGLDLHLKLNILHYSHNNHWLSVTDDLKRPRPLHCPIPVQLGLLSIDYIFLQRIPVLIFFQLIFSLYLWGPNSIFLYHKWHWSYKSPQPANNNQCHQYRHDRTTQQGPYTTDYYYR